MSLQHTSSRQTARSPGPSTATVRLQGSILMLARGGWIVGVVAVLVIFFATLPANFAYLHTVRANGIILGYGQLGQLAPEGLRRLQALGLSADFYAIYITASRVIFVMIWFVVGVFIFWRKSDERVALLASFALVAFPIGFSGTITLAALPPAWWLPLQFMQFLGGMGFSIFLYTFPSGQFVPRWTPWLLIGWAIEESGVTFLSTVPLNASLHSLIDGFLFIGLLASIVAVQVYRYRRVFTLKQRQQTKWVVFGTTVGIVGFVATLIVGVSFFAVDTQSRPLASLIGNTFLDLFLLFIPLSIGFAILRSRLWDIDIIINRTLVYGSLTALLALIYFGLIFALQSLFQGLFKQNNAVAIVVSTLVIAALFQPLRRRIQAIIDRRFYRRKYDAAKIVEEFSATLRNEVDLSQLSENLLAVVQETMQPTFVSLWLRKPQQVEKH